MKKIILSLTALIFLCSAFIILSDTRKAEVEKTNGVYVFIKCTPVDAYNVVGTVDCPAVVNKKTMEYMADLMVKRAKDKYTDFDGIIFKEDMWTGIVVKFK